MMARYAGFRLLDHKEPVHTEDEGAHITISMYVTIPIN
jgi:hypothetical protein